MLGVLISIDELMLWYFDLAINVYENRKAPQADKLRRLYKLIYLVDSEKPFIIYAYLKAWEIPECGLPSQVFCVDNNSPIKSLEKLATRDGLLLNSQEMTICVTISTEIGEVVEEVITFPPKEDFGLELRKYKSKPLFFF